MSPTSFLEHWEQHYPAASPVGYLLRTQLPDRWFRIHSLPESKRYAGTAQERRALLDRQNAILTDLLGLEGHVVLLCTEFSSDPTPTVADTGDPPLAYADAPLMTVVLPDAGEPHGDEPSHYAHIFMSEHRWHPGMMDTLLQRVADWQITNVLLVGVDQRCIFAPYDGGADIVVASHAMRGHLRDTYAAWLSPYPGDL